MVLFIIIAIGIFIYTIFAKDFLLDSIKNLDEYNKDIEEKIRYGCTNYDSFSYRKYCFVVRILYTTSPEISIHCFLSKLMIILEFDCNIVMIYIFHNSH